MRLFLACLTLLATLTNARAQPASEQSLPLDAELDRAAPHIYLTWRDAERVRVGPIDINRRILGETGGSTWQPLVRNLDPVIGYRDDTIETGVAYEYQVIRKARDIVDVGYWATGLELPAVEQRGIALMVVDDTLADGLADHLDRFEQDLTGDGWRVKRKRTPRHNPDPEQNLEQARALKDWIAQQWGAAPETPHSLILIGHVPVVQSGRVAPDGHDAEPHATDQFYADINSHWPEGYIGKLRPSTIPDLKVELSVGRIDFNPVSYGYRSMELPMLKAYFDKNHHWRHGFLGDLRDAYAQGKRLLVEEHALRNVVGPDALQKGGHHDIGEEKPWLWGVDFGSWRGFDYAKKYSNKAVFAVNFGSGKQKFDRTNNAMTALLAQPWYNVAVGWGGRPAWRLHHMALGGTIGDVHLRTINNGTTPEPYRIAMDYYPTGLYLWRNPVWVNLMGDPTLRAFPLAPPRRLTAQRTDAGMRLTWAASPDGDVLGYRLYRANGAARGFTLVNTDALIKTPDFTDPNPGAYPRYMLRAYGLKQVYAGSFYTYSQGVFADPDSAPVQAADAHIRARSGLPLAVSPESVAATGANLQAFIEGPSAGWLKRVGRTWVYTAPNDFTGEVALRVSASSLFETTEARVIITVTPAPRSTEWLVQ